MNAQNAKTDNRGSLLLFVLGVLALLSLLGTVLVFMSNQEDRSAKNYLDLTRAEFAAESGVETAIAKIMQFDKSLTDFPQYLSFGPEPGYTPISKITNPSFQIDVDNNGVLDDMSGVVSETYAKYGDRFRLKVESCQSKLNINDTNSPMNIDTDPYEDQWTPERDYMAIPENLRYPTIPNDPSKDKDPDWAYMETWPGYFDPDVNGDGVMDQKDIDHINYLFSNGGAPLEIAKADVNRDGGVDALDKFKVQACLNAGFDPMRSPQGKPHPRAQGRLYCVLRELVKALFPGDEALPDKVARSIFVARSRLPDNRFQNMEELHAILVPSILTENQYSILAGNLTLHAWENKQVLRPTFQWRVSVPPRLDASNPISSHPSMWNGDAPIDWFCLEQINNYGASLLPTSLPKRPGYSPASALPGSRGGDIGDPYAFDFNGDGMLTDARRVEDSNFYDPSTEVSMHNRDIYRYSDMQTRFFELEARCPVDVNNASKELIQALLTPVQGWYLKEAPSQWNGESIDSRAEDWSQNPPYYGPPGWMVSGGLGFPFIRSYGLLLGPIQFGCYGIGTGHVGDVSQFYYYDETSKYQLAQNSHGTFDVWFARKSNRFGELAQSKSLASVSSMGGRSIAELLAEKIYNRVHLSGYKPFVTWEEFENFIFDLCDTDSGSHLTGNASDFDLYMAHALIANFNPNSRINDYNPNKRFFLHVDKSQLSGFSTEFCFHPMGCFQVESRGEIKKTDRDFAATQQLKSCFRTHELFMVTTQSQFLLGNCANGLPKSGELFSESTGLLPTAGAEQNKGFWGDSLQSYPEPLLDDAGRIRDSIFDGYLALATWEPTRLALFETGLGRMDEDNRFHINFGNSLNASYCQNNSTSIFTDYPTSSEQNSEWVLHPKKFAGHNTLGGFLFDSSYQLPANFPGERPLTGPLKNTDSLFTKDTIPGNLYPDGAFSDVGRSLCYPGSGVGNSTEGGRIGSLQFWVKPGFDTTHSNRPRKWFSMAPWSDYQLTLANCREFSLFYFSRGGSKVARADDGKFDDYVNTDPVPNWNINDGRWLATRALYFCLCNPLPPSQSVSMKGMGTPSLNHDWRSHEETQNTSNDYLYNMQTRQWSHVAFSWHHLKDPSCAMCVNGWSIDPLNNNGMTPNFDMSSPANFVRFGEPSSAQYRNQAADATFDDIVASDRDHPEDVLGYEYEYGRYYSENNAAYSSPEFDLFSGDKDGPKVLELCSVSWTLYWPFPLDKEVGAGHFRFNDNLDGNNSSLYTRVESVGQTNFDYNPSGESDPMYDVWDAKVVPASVDFHDVSIGSWRYERNGVKKEDMPNYAGGSIDPDWRANPLRWEKARGDKFRFRVHFNIEEGQTLYSSPIFDDITFVFKMDKAEILSWEPNFED